MTTKTIKDKYNDYKKQQIKNIYTVCYLSLGAYQYHFTETGDFYVWSGYVDEWGIKNYVGTIKVVEPVSVLAEISVTLAGREALHDVGGRIG